MKTIHFIVLCTFIVATVSQRSPYAGQRPVGYPTLATTTTTLNPLANRFGDAPTTERLPIEALGDRDLVNRLSKMPIDQQPFWYINWRALEEQRKNQQTYEQRPNPFLEDAANILPQGQNQANSQTQSQAQSNSQRNQRSWRNQKN